MQYLFPILELEIILFLVDRPYLTVSYSVLSLYLANTIVPSFSLL